NIRQRLHRRRVFEWSIATAGVAAVVLTVLLIYSRGPLVKNPIAPDSAQTERPGISPPPVQRGPEIQKTPSTSTTPPQPTYEIARLDLRNVSVDRTVEGNEQRTQTKPIELARALIRLTVELPAGSPAGVYDLEIRTSDQQPLRTARGSATI